jgi:hypothetical protein
MLQVCVLIVPCRHALRVDGRERHPQMLARVGQVVAHRFQIIRLGHARSLPAPCPKSAPKLQASSLSEEPSERAHSHDALHTSTHYGLLTHSETVCSYDLYEIVKSPIPSVLYPPSRETFGIGLLLS